MPELTPEYHDAEAEVFTPLWYAGWFPKLPVIATPVILALSTVIVGAPDYTTIGAFYGLPLGGLIYFIGTVHINRSFRPIVEAFVDSVERAARSMMAIAGEDASTYTLRSSTGSRRFIHPNRVHRPTVLLVGESSLAVHDGAVLQLDRLAADIGPKTREYYYDSVTSVTYDAPFFEIKTADGGTDQYRSSREPDDALYELQNRLRAYKQQT